MPRGWCKNTPSVRTADSLANYALLLYNQTMENKSLLLILVLFFIGVTFAFLAGFGIFYFSHQEGEGGLSALFGGGEEPSQVTVSPTPALVIPSPTPYVPIEESTSSASAAVDLEVCADWASYTNAKYDYSFRYDPEWMIKTNMPGYEKDDRIVLQGDISEKGWPSIEINLQEFDSMPETAEELMAELEELWGDSVAMSLVEFGANDIPAVKLSTEDSPQAYAMESYYFIHSGNYFVLSLNDAAKEEARAIYDCFLANFETLEE